MKEEEFKQRVVERTIELLEKELDEYTALDINKTSMGKSIMNRKRNSQVFVDGSILAPVDISAKEMKKEDLKRIQEFVDKAMDRDREIFLRQSGFID